MKRFRYYLFLLLIALTLFFNIERIDLLGQQNVLDIQSFVYNLVTLAVFSIIFVPTLWRTPAMASIIGWLVIYIICKVLFFNIFPDQNPIFGGAFTYVTITEAAFLSILILYTHRLINNLVYFEEGVKDLLYKERLQRVDEARETINTEVMRSRHYHRPMSVIVVEPEATSLKKTFNVAIQEIQNKLVLHYTKNKLAKTIRQQLRLMDMVLEEDKNGRFVILCPEVDASESVQLVKRIETAVQQALALDIHCGAASFPDEAPTFDGLIEQAIAKIQHHKTASEQASYHPVQHIYRSQEHHV